LLEISLSVVDYVILRNSRGTFQQTFARLLHAVGVNPEIQTRHVISRSQTRSEIKRRFGLTRSSISSISVDRGSRFAIKLREIEVKWKERFSSELILIDASRVIRDYRAECMNFASRSLIPAGFQQDSSRISAGTLRIDVKVGKSKKRTLILDTRYFGKNWRLKRAQLFSSSCFLAADNAVWRCLSNIRTGPRPTIARKLRDLQKNYRSNLLVLSIYLIDLNDLNESA